MKQIWVHRGWNYEEQYTRLEGWVENNKDVVEWDKLNGWSSINGRMYFSKLNFSNDEDIMWCKMMFPEIVD